MEEGKESEKGVAQSLILVVGSRNGRVCRSGDDGGCCIRLVRPHFAADKTPETEDIVEAERGKGIAGQGMAVEMLVGCIVAVRG